MNAAAAIAATNTPAPTPGLMLRALIRSRRVVAIASTMSSNTGTIVAVLAAGQPQHLAVGDVERAQRAPALHLGAVAVPDADQLPAAVLPPPSSRCLAGVLQQHRQQVDDRDVGGEREVDAGRRRDHHNAAVRPRLDRRHAAHSLAQPSARTLHVRTATVGLLYGAPPRVIEPVHDAACRTERDR